MEYFYCKITKDGRPVTFVSFREWFRRSNNFEQWHGFDNLGMHAISSRALENVLFFFFNQTVPIFFLFLHEKTCCGSH